ncbi:LysE/ArgO family amino acid transporter [Agromyces aerolatus]|uniref:LysE/ArgO family amino acid transporter n=1 Tax=Agromyces sp. LY-1074 TaxID=3074080 RepID=UPI002862D065|nr:MULTISPECIES: LysE/ArgO family amino acid transporter [unclassified Agromyces]MDR5701247.1 LysE/ArgO family amino acid transporter [Agromyces sp. LY-1074]MDR5706877.1 LysE/ArgO family amino acid transporter [Agromyces sp. LY-1358]
MPSVDAVDLSTFAAGLGLGLSLIIAIGAQNLFVLRQGIRREHVLAVALTCAISDLVLILVGVSGVGAVLAAVPWLIDVVRWAGAAFLVAYGLLAAKRAWRPSGATLEVDGTTDPEASAGREARAGTEASARPSATTGTPATVAVAPRRGTLAATLATCLALTWLNPHVYLDTVFLLGTVANTHGDGRWVFAAGASLGSLAWFLGLAYGARLLGGVLASPRAWRILDAVIAVVMIALGVSLVVPH